MVVCDATDRMRTNLILIPTAFEREHLEPHLRGVVSPAVRIELCGFGPVVAAARTATLVAGLRPQRVILVGIAGSLSRICGVGSAWQFERVACHGIGVGTGELFETAETMGWKQWPGSGEEHAGVPLDTVGDELVCGSAGSGAVASSHAASAPLLVTACAASATPDDAATRRRIYPSAAAEDMEGFGVAAACRLGGVPCEIVRGISNIAGDRDKATWQVAIALQAAASLVRRLLEEDT